MLLGVKKKMMVKALDQPDCLDVGYVILHKINLLLLLDRTMTVS